jgi:hypothetical protein
MRRGPGNGRKAVSLTAPTAGADGHHALRDGRLGGEDRTKGILRDRARLLPVALSPRSTPFSMGS